MRVEFLYTHKDNITTVYIWDGMRLVDKRSLNGVLTIDQQSKITKEIKDESNKR